MEKDSLKGQLMNIAKKTIKKAFQDGSSLVRVEYNEFEGSYFISKPEYKLQIYVEKLLNERTILPTEIEELLDLHTDAINHDRDMEECD
jgi:hypothetical protein